MSAFVEVKRSDIAPFAKKNCRACGGLGQFMRDTITPTMARRDNVLCGCAMRRFQKASTEGRFPLQIKETENGGKVLEWVNPARVDVEVITPSVVTSVEVK